MAEKIICTSECEKCIHSKIVECSKGRIYVDCDVKCCRLFYGQFIPCDDFSKEKGDK